MSGPLEGYRIVDVTTVIAGPFATMILADQGADVIKVEGPNRVDHTRNAGYSKGGLTAAFVNNNRNKRSVALDLKSQEGQEALKRLVATADVFIQNFRPGVCDRLGIGEAELRKIKPDLIYVSMSGWGEVGPLSHKPVYDPIIQALSGLTTVQGGSDEERPRLIRTIVPDKVTALTAAQAVASALAAKERTGKGQHVKLSMLEAVVAFLWSSDMGGQTFVGHEVSVQRAATFIDLIYDTQDGYISVSVMTDQQWLAFCTAVDRLDLLEDPRFLTPALRDQNADVRLNIIQEELLKRPASEWLTLLDDAGVPCAPVLKRGEMIHHPQVQATGIVSEFEHVHAGTLRQARAAATFEGTPTTYRRGAPLLGEHSRELLREAGLSDEEISALQAKGVVQVQDEA
ncbi:MAG: CoA transferase [Gammaproteobacteria bacterium]|nr:CoA transferase [Gammaproteobacteria bacterium]